MKTEQVIFKNIISLNDGLKLKVLSWRNQDFVRLRMFDRSVISAASHFKYIESLKINKSKSIFICFFDDAPIACVNYEILPEQSVIFGYYLTDEKYINAGFGVVLEYCVLERVFTDLRKDKLFCTTITENEKTIALHSKMGFSVESVYTENGYNITKQAIFPEQWNIKKDGVKKILKALLKDNFIVAWE